MLCSISADRSLKNTTFSVYRKHDKVCRVTVPQFYVCNLHKCPTCQALYILYKVQKSRMNAVLNPTKYFRDVVTLASFM